MVVIGTVLRSLLRGLQRAAAGRLCHDAISFVTFPERRFMRELSFRTPGNLVFLKDASCES